jgi:hypothetical protein
MSLRTHWVAEKPKISPTERYFTNTKTGETEMGFMRTNNKVTVNCKKNHDNGKRLTLVDNMYGEVHDFDLSTGVLKYLLDEGFTGVANYIDELVAKKVGDEQEKRKWRTYSFFVKKGNAPYVINRIDSSEHLKNWEISEGMFKDEGMVRIEYVADKQILHQSGDGIVIDL